MYNFIGINKNININNLINYKKLLNIKNYTVFIFYYLVSLTLFYLKFDIYYVYIYFLFLLVIFLLIYIFFFNYLNSFIFFNFYLFMYYIFFICSLYLNASSIFTDFIYIFILNISKLYNNSILYIFILELSNLDCLFSTTAVQITFFVNIFIYTYMYYDINFSRFFILINLFSFSMIFLLHSKNLILLFFFWELIGITSFLLICFFFSKPISIKSSFKALSFNRLSDICFISFISIYFIFAQSLNIDINIFNKFILNSNTYTILFCNINVINIFIIFIIISSFIKSAQFIFHFWLPDSMEAPAPASALIHSATLVAAGIFLFNKFFFFIFYNNFALLFISYVTSFTFLFGAFVSSYNSDIKKILAYSTISNCGLMFFSIISSDSNLSILYFILHGFFKSSSFIYIGYIIYLNKHKQDFKLFTGLNFFNITKITLVLFLLLSLSSTFFLYTSFIKHLLIQNFFINILIKIFLFIGSIFSIIYSLKFIYFICYKNSSINKYINFNNIYLNLYGPISYTYFIFIWCLLLTNIISINNYSILCNYLINFIIFFIIFTMQSYIFSSYILIVFIFFLLYCL